MRKPDPVRVIKGTWMLAVLGLVWIAPMGWVVLVLESSALLIALIVVRVSYRASLRREHATYAEPG